MKKTYRHISLTLLIIFGFTAIAFLSNFDRIEPISFGDKIILNQEAKPKYGIGSIWDSIWKAEIDHYVDCCPVKFEYQLSFNAPDSVGILIQVISEYEDYFELPFLNHVFGRIGEQSFTRTAIYEMRGLCLVEMAKNNDMQIEVGPPALESYSEIGCDLLPTDWPVRSYILQQSYDSIVIERFQ